jgi:hypothetical protein
MNRQLDFFVAEPPSPLAGLRVRMDRPIDRDNPCCRNHCIIGSAKGPHAAELTCADCGQHRGWLSKTTTHWIERVIERFGAPRELIVVRAAHSYAEEVTNQTN